MKNPLKKLFYFFCLCAFLSAHAYSQSGDKMENEFFDCAVKIKAEFLSSGKVGKAFGVSSSCDDEKLEQEALKAAKNIKFEPKKKDGKPVTVTRTVAYTFSLLDKEKAETDGSAGKDKSVKILRKPAADYPKSDTGTVCITGTVTLTVEFLSSGKIGEIQVISGLPFGATENAIEAAKKIKFEPAVKDGKPITTFKTVTYKFTIY